MQFGTEAKKLCRRDGTDTSKDAASRLDSVKLEKMVYDVIASYGELGCISDDVRNCLPHLPYSSVTARYRSLLDKGIIVDTGQRRIGETGRSQRVMRINTNIQMGLL